MGRYDARTIGRKLAREVIDALPDDPYDREHVLSVLQAEVNAEYRANFDVLHRMAVGDGPCRANRCKVHAA